MKLTAFKTPFYRFIVLSVCAYLVWFVLYDLYLKQEGSLDYFLGRGTAEFTVYFLRLLGYDASYKYFFSLHFFYNASDKILKMVPACNGQVLYPLFIGFIIASPGLLKDKLKFIIVGCVLIFFINVLRVLALCLVKINASEYLAFNHKYTFTIIVYGFIFIMWIVWINYFVPKAIQKSKIENAVS